MSQMHVCDRCGVRLTLKSCPDTRRHFIKVGSWYGVSSSAFNDGGADTRTLDLCNDCYNQLINFLGITISQEVSKKYLKERMHGYGGDIYPDETEYTLHMRKDVQNG